MHKSISPYLKNKIIAEYNAYVAKGFAPKGGRSGAHNTSATSAVAKALGVNSSTVRTALLDIPSVKGAVTEKPLPAPSPRPSAVAVKDEILALDAEVKKILTGLCEPPHIGINPIAYEKSDEELIPIFLLSDWHLGETIDSEQVFGFNAFNEKIAEDRVNKLAGKSIGLAREHTRAKEAIIWLGGDFVSGWLHAELIATDYCSPLEAVHWATGKIYWLLKAMADEFSKVTVYCSPGNHGRVQLKPVAKGSTKSNYDWLVYAQLKQWLNEDKRIFFNIPIEGDSWVDIQGFRFLFTHGDKLGVKGGDGIIGALGPIIRGAVKTSRSLASVGRDYDYLVIGHYHQSLWQPGQGVIVNGAFVGFSEFSKMMRFRAELPSQTLFFVHKKYGPISPINIFLD